VHPPPRLFGRIRELEILRQLTANVRGGQSAVLVVRGEPGIGKTELLRCLIAEASGFRVARAVGVESEMELAFAGLHQLCASMLGGLGSLAEPQRRGLSIAFGLDSGDSPDRFLVALAALGLMAETSEERPLLCVVDDAQWLDQASAQVLGFVGRRLLAESIALVFAVRTPTEAGLLDAGPNVRFRHPLVRSAVYRAAAAQDRRAAHDALAAVTDPGVDPDRRAWHRAHAAAGPDEAVAAELISSAGRALRRGGIAAAAAFWERAVALTPDPGERASRALAAAEVKYAAGDFQAAQVLLVTADLGPLSELGHARVQRMRAQIAFALRRGRDAPPLLLQAAQRLQALDAELAGRTYLEALVAVIYAGRLGPGAGEVARAARLAPSGPKEPKGSEPAHAQLLLRGLAVRLTDGYLAAAPLLREALRRYRTQPQELDWLCVSYNLVAMDLWDDEAWFELAAGQVRLARANGTLSWLPFALDYLAELHIQGGELSAAAALLLEGERIDPGIRAATLPYVPLLLAAWRGDRPAADELAGAMVRGAADRGEGAALTYAEYAQAVLYNGLGQPGLAAQAAHRASSADELVISPWALYELTEAAARGDQRERAVAAADRLAGIAEASGSAWARGAAARSRALLASGRAADQLYREAIELLGRTRMATHLARARLSYGEWLRRENRRIEARDQLRPAFDALAAMAPRPSPNVPGASSRPPARRCAGATKIRPPS
jgi:AAA ATPase domain